MKKKVVIFIHHLQHYRIPIFDYLSEQCDLTVVCENKDDYGDRVFKFSVLESNVKKIGPFLLHDRCAHKIANSFDVVIGLFNVRCLDLVAMAINPFRKYKFIFWGIGVSASYTKKFDQKGFVSNIRQLLGCFADALVFYSSYPVKRYMKVRNRESLFVANNTIYNPFYKECKVNKNRLIFIGTLYKEKGLDVLLSAYKEAFEILGEEMFSFDIIGDGSERADLENMVRMAGLSHKITFHGAIYDQSIIADFYREAIVCLSPCQAGLSVLTSMSNAVPFVTTASAITGGEIFSIENGVTGVVLEDSVSLSDILIDINRVPAKYIQMGANARMFYESNRLPEMMADGIFQAIEYVSR